MISKKRSRRVFSFAEKSLSSLRVDPLGPPASPSLSSVGGGGCAHAKRAGSSRCFPTWGQQGSRMETGSAFSGPILNHLLSLCPNVCFDWGGMFSNQEPPDLFQVRFLMRWVGYGLVIDGGDGGMNTGSDDSRRLWPVPGEAARGGPCG